MGRMLLSGECEIRWMNPIAWITYGYLPRWFVFKFRKDGYWKAYTDCTGDTACTQSPLFSIENTRHYIAILQDIGTTNGLPKIPMKVWDCGQIPCWRPSPHKRKTICISLYELQTSNLWPWYISSCTIIKIGKIPSWTQFPPWFCDFYFMLYELFKLW